MRPGESLLELVREARRRLEVDGPISVRAGGDFERVSLGRTDGDVLRDLLIPECPITVVEIGLAYGGSALAIAEAMIAAGAPDVRHVVIDAHQDEFHDSGWNTLLGAGLGSMCSLIRQRSQTALPRLLTEGVVADAAFVDGSHLYHNVFVDLYFLHELVHPGGLVILDDYDWPSVATAARYFETNMGWRAEEIGAPTRLRAFRLPDPKTEPSFEDFRPFGLDTSN